MPQLVAGASPDRQSSIDECLLYPAHAAQRIFRFPPKAVDQRLGRGRQLRSIPRRPLSDPDGRILGLLDVAQTPQDMNIPAFKLHPLKGDLAGHWSVWVNGNWRVTFRFVETGVELVNYQDYH